MNSTLKMITNSPLLPERNFKLESMSDIANGSDGASVISDFQYIKHSLMLSIKVNLDQINLDFVQSNNVNYITITNNTTNAKEIGYFVINKKWVAEKTIQFDLKMDTINSFLNECVLSDKTKILRQHKDRYKITGIKSNGEFDNAVVETYDADVVFDGDDLGITINDTFPQATSVEKSLIIKISDLEDLAFFERTNESYTIRYNFEDAVPLTISFTTYLLDNDYKITRQIDSLSNDADYSIDYNGKLKNNTITIASNEKYIAIRCVMTFTEPEEPTDLDYYYSIRYTGGAWEDITPEEIAECKTGFESGESSMLAFGTYVAPVDTLKFYPLIDRYPENVNPILYGRTLRTFREKGYLDQSWYLVYKNQNTPDSSLVNPVDCYVFPSRKVLTKANASSTTLTFNGEQLGNAIFPVLNIPSWDYYNAENEYNDVILTPKNNNGCRFQVSPATPSDLSPTIDITMNSGDNDFIILRPARNGVLILVVGYGYSLTWFVYGSSDTITITDGTKAVQGVDWGRTELSQINNWPVFPFFDVANTSQTMGTIDDVDRTDAKLIKIIKLPYCPINSYIDTDGYLIYDADQWEVVAYAVSVNAYKLKQLNGTTFSRLLQFDGSNPFSVITTPLPFTPTTSMEKSSSWETKLLHSEFYQPKVIYDSFGFTFQLELMNFTESLSSFEVQYNVSGSITSKFLFTFVDYKCSTTEVQDYNNIMYISRNNDCVIYNQQYINYLRTGYNYDRESLDIKNQQLAVSTGYSSAWAITDKGMSGYKTGGIAGAIIGTGRGMMDMGLSIYQMVNDVMVSEMSLQAKQRALQNASTGVIDANDVDLMTIYTQNVLTYKLYYVSPKMEQVLFDMFYYTGYVAGVMGLPDTTSRCRFNFVSAEIIFKKLPNLSNEIIDDIKARYLVGISFLHKVSNTYDFDQHYENWENSILQAIGG